MNHIVRATWHRCSRRSNLLYRMDFNVGFFPSVNTRCLLSICDIDLNMDNNVNSVCEKSWHHVAGANEVASLGLNEIWSKYRVELAEYPVWLPHNSVSRSPVVTVQVKCLSLLHHVMLRGVQLQTQWQLLRCYFNTVNRWRHCNQLSVASLLPGFINPECVICRQITDWPVTSYHGYSSKHIMCQSTSFIQVSSFPLKLSTHPMHV